MTNYPNKFEYFNESIGLTFALWGGTIIAVLLCLCCTCRDYRRDVSRGYFLNRIADASDDTLSFCKCQPLNCKTQTTEFFSGTIFESTYVSLRGTHWSVLLLITRVLSFAFFLAVPLIWRFIDQHGYNWIYFTFWNIELIVLYYLFASIASIIGLVKKPSVCSDLSDENLNSYEWTSAEEFVGITVQILYVVAAPTSLFITVFSYIFLSKSTSLFNVSYHLMNLLAFVLEFALNSISVRFEHLLFIISWFLLYCVYTWGMVRSGESPDYPYNAVKTDSSASLVWYFILYLISVIVFFIWYAMTKIKFCVRGKYAQPLLSLKTKRESGVVVRPSVV